MIMGRNIEDNRVVLLGRKGSTEDDIRKSVLNSIKRSPGEDACRPSSMIIKKANAVLPAHIVAEAISTLHGLDLRWSGPITPSEMQYVEQYVLAKYPEYSSALVEGSDKTDLYDLCIKEEAPLNSDTLISPDSGRSRKSPGSRDTPSSNLPDIDKIQLEPSRLLDILNKKSSFLGSFISIPEIQARNRVLNHCGLPEEDYLVLFTHRYKDAMMLVGESYPFFRGNFYLSIIGEEGDFVREFAMFKGSKVILAPETWLDLRIKGSQLSQYFRRKCKLSPKGLFSYTVEMNDDGNGMRHSMHWVSEAHRNSWHVLLDATALVVGKDRLNLALHRPDFVLCSIENNNAQSHDHGVDPPSNITCLLVRKKSFD